MSSFDKSDPARLSPADEARVIRTCAVFARFIETIPQSALKAAGIDEPRTAAMARTDIAARLTESFFVGEAADGTNETAKAIYDGNV